eukprot:gene751-9003_t
MRRAKDLSYEEISKYFSCPIHQACIYLKVERTDLKQRCEELKIKKWPYRQYQRKKVKPPSGMFDSFQATHFESESPIVLDSSAGNLKPSEKKSTEKDTNINQKKDSTEEQPIEKNEEEKTIQPESVRSKMSISNLIDKNSPEK